MEGEPYDPDTDADEYGLSLARATEFGPNIEVVRMDTAHGQKPHMGLTFLPTDIRPMRQVELDEGYTYDRMKRFFLTHWRNFVDGYIYYNK